MPLKGTSRQRVGLSPRHKEATPSEWTRDRMAFSVDRSVCGFLDDCGVDCRLVRINSSGEAIVVMVARARMPAVSGSADG